MQKKATRFFTSFPEKSRLIQPVLLLLVLVSLACVLPEAISPQPTATRPDSKTAASPTPEPTLNAPYPAALLDTWPANGSGLERQPEISFYFNQPMKHDLVEKSISFQPAINGKFTWVDDATLKFSPDLPLPLQSDLKVDFGLQAQSQSGQAMVTPVTLTYHLPAALKINEKIPAPGAAAVDPSLPVLVSFNQPIMPLMVGAQSDDTPAFTLEPHTEGKGAWLNTSTYVFYPATALKGNTAYQLSLRADLAGSGEEKGWNFNTAQVSVKSVSPSPEKGPLGLDGAIQVQFNQPVNRQSVEKNASLRSDSSPSPIEGTITWNDNSTQMSFKPASLLTRDSSYAFVLSTAVQSASGENLAVDQSFKYHTAAALGLVESAPVQNGKITYDSNYSNITLKFNNGLGRQDLTSLVRLDPPVGDLNVYSVENNTLMVSGLFKPETNYHLAISDALVDRWGGKLAAPLALDFSTTAASASLNISMLEYSETLFLRPEDAALSAQAFNLNSLLVQSQRLQLGEFITLDGNYDAKNAFNLSQFDAWLLHYTNTNQGKAVQVSLSKTGAAIKPGLYYYRLTSPDLDKTNKKEVNFMAVVSHIQLTLKRSLKEMFVWAVDLNTNQPAAQKNISMVNPAGNVVGFCTTDPKGTCTVQLPTGVKDPDLVAYYAVMGSPGDPDFALSLDSWRLGVEGYDFGLPTLIQKDQPFVYLYTDRPIYKPGQTVDFRAVVRTTDNGRYLLPDLKALKVKVVRDDAGDPLQAPFKLEIPITLSPYGSASASFTLPDDTPVGYYHFEFDQDVSMPYTGFAVADYRKPQVELQVNFAAADQKVGSDLSASVNAKYYFGSPAAKLPLNWTLYAAPDYFPMPDGFQTGNQAYFWDPAQWPTAGLGEEIASGSGTTGVDGGYQISIPAGSLDGLNGAVINHLTLEATLADDSASPVSARTSMQMHPADIYIGVRPDEWGSQVGKETGFVIQTTDWKTNPSGGRSLSARLEKVSWQQPENGGIGVSLVYPKPVFTQVDSSDIKTDASGQARVAFTPQAPGNYRLVLEGEGASTSLWLWVGGGGAISWANLPNQHLQISSDSSSYTAGQTAHLSIPNPLGANSLALITVERSKVMQSQVVTFNDSSSSYDLPVTEDMGPNVFIAVTLVGHAANGLPDFRQGYEEIKVTPKKETLKVAFVAQPQATRPGGQVLLAMQVKDSDGKPVKGEFSVSLVDKAVLALADPNSQDIVSAFYGRNDLGVLTSLSLAGYANRISQVAGGGKGGGGGNNTPEMRQNFADTAYWRGDVVTDDQGMAQIQVKLPDNLTTWVAQVRGVTQATQVGEAVLELVTSKPLMVEPVMPRFVVVGDHVQLGAVVYNNTSSALNSQVSLAVNGIKLDDAGQAVQKMSIDPGGKVRVNWWGMVEDVKAADMIFSAVSGDLMDQTRLEQGSLPVVRYETSQTNASMGLMTEAGSQSQMIQMPRLFVPTGGELDLEFSPSMAAVVLGGLKQEETPTYESNENLVSSLLPGLNVNTAFQKGNQLTPDLKDNLDKLVRRNVLKLQANQNEDGGWGWAKGYTSSDFMSAYVLLGLGQSALAGYPVDSTLLQKAQQHLQTRLLAAENMNDPSAYNRHVFMQFALQSSGVAQNFSGVSMEDWSASYQFAGRLSPWAEALLALGVKHAQPDNALAGLIASDLVSKISRMPSGVSWVENQPDPENLSSPNFNTAVVIYALSQLSTDPTILNQAALYLVLHQRANGGWNSSYESAWVLMGLSQVMLQNNESKAGFGFSSMLNNQLVAVNEPDKVNPASTVENTIPFSQLRLNYPNILTINRNAGGGSLFYRVFLKVNQPAETAQPLQKGLTITRRYELGGQDCPTLPCPQVTQVNLQTLKSPLTVHLSLVLPAPMYYLAVEDTVPAGVEIVNRLLKTTKQGADQTPALVSGEDPFGNGWNAWYFGDPAIGDHSLRWLAEKVPAGSYDLTYQIQPQYLGQYHILPAHAYEIYYPEVEGRSAGGVMEIGN